ncbi:MAG: hypothetical protein NTW08_01615 [Gammaproteobacteria bacterium]|nr:hypothetical protein [Gammaproteobacteria bacterium]
MKLKKWIVCSSVLVSAQAIADCSLPCGAEELITCAAQAVGKTAEQYYNSVLFNTDNLDGYCKAPKDLNGSQLQQKYYDAYCTPDSVAAGYFGYANFISASQLFPEFGCYPNTTKERRYKELSNFLTTIAQETTSAASGYTNDGLYFRYENSVLLPGTCTGDGTCWDYKTAYYYQAAPYYIARSNAGTAPVPPTGMGTYTTYTDRLWQPDPSPATQGALYYIFYTPPDSGTTTPKPVKIVYQWNMDAAANAVAVTSSAYALTAVNDPTVLPESYWIGMGPKQLTADTMYAFYGYYYQHPEIQTPTPGTQQNYQNFYSFVSQYLLDGKLAFTGAFWYWMERINGQTSLGFRPIHKIVNDPNRPVCQDIATVTRMVNGGCNHYDRRLVYYKYFNSTFHIPTTAIIEGNLNSLACTPELQAYCEKG